MLFIDSGNNLLLVGGATSAASLLAVDATAGIIVNDAGAAAVDFRVEADTTTHALFVDATGAGTVVLGSTDGTAANSLVSVDATAVVVNNISGVTNFRVESGGYEYAFQVDGTNDIIGIGGATANTILKASAAGIEINSAGAAGLDFKCQADTTEFMLFVDATGAGLITSGSTDGASATSTFAHSTAVGTIVNDLGNATSDFRVEGDATVLTVAEDPANLLFVDASTMKVGIGEAAPLTLLHVAGAAGSTDPVLMLEQNDDDEAFFNLVGTSAADQTKSISTVNGAGAVVGPQARAVAEEAWTFAGMTKHEVNGTPVWIPYYTATV